LFKDRRGNPQATRSTSLRAGCPCNRSLTRLTEQDTRHALALLCVAKRLCDKYACPTSCLARHALVLLCIALASLYSEAPL